MRRVKLSPREKIAKVLAPADLWEFYEAVNTSSPPGTKENCEWAETAMALYFKHADEILGLDLGFGNRPKMPLDSLELEPGETYAKWALQKGPQTLDDLLGSAEHAAGYDDPSFDASLGALFIVSWHTIRATAEKTRELLHERDAFIVNKGLWEEFCASLP